MRLTKRPGHHGLASHPFLTLLPTFEMLRGGFGEMWHGLFGQLGGASPLLFSPGSYAVSQVFPWFPLESGRVAVNFLAGLGVLPRYSCEVAHQRFPKVSIGFP